MRTLKDLPIGQKATVSKLLGFGPTRRRIMDMGVTKGTEVEIVKVAPLGDPMEIKVRGYQLTLRKEDAQEIQVC